jgi:hypothetical protein
MEYPELSKYLEEMPLNVSENDKDAINIKNLNEYYNSLKELLAQYSKTHKDNKEKNTPEKLKFPGYPIYPPSEDMSGDDLDVPGSELDDQQESVGSEDEENNYYSLGGDDHNDLDENKG